MRRDKEFRGRPERGQKEARKSVPERVNDISEQRDAARTSLHGSAHRLGRELGTSSRMDDRRSFALTRAGGGRICWERPFLWTAGLGVRTGKLFESRL